MHHILTKKNYIVNSQSDRSSVSATVKHSHRLAYYSTVLSWHKGLTLILVFNYLKKLRCHSCMQKIYSVFPTTHYVHFPANTPLPATSFRGTRWSRLHLTTIWQMWQHNSSQHSWLHHRSRAECIITCSTVPVCAVSASMLPPWCQKHTRALWLWADSVVVIHDFYCHSSTPTHTTDRREKKVAPWTLVPMPES